MNHVNVHSNNIMSDGLMEIACALIPCEDGHFARLQSLDVSDNAICNLRLLNPHKPDGPGVGDYSPAGLEVLSKALVLNGSLTRLNLSNNILGLDGSNVLFTAFTPNEALKFSNIGTLMLSNCQLGMGGQVMVTDKNKNK